MGGLGGWNSHFYFPDARKGLDDVEGLGDPADPVVFILEGFDVLQGDLFTPDIPEDKIKIEDDDF